MSNYCQDCGEEFTGYGAYCPECLPKQDEDNKKHHQFCVNSQKSREFDEALAQARYVQLHGEPPYYARPPYNY
jgi:predicted amidophosphoribosyltransferase